MTEMAELRAEAAKDRASSAALRSALPTEEARRGTPEQLSMIKCPFPRPPKFRAEMVEYDGLDYFLVEGYASMTEIHYEMYDMFGPYNEIVSKTAFDKTLAAKPEVKFRVQHSGIPMANTNENHRLELWADSLGLGDRAYLNPKRSEVQELMLAIEDRDLTEQSFMFSITDGQWNDDFTEFRINEVDLERGDVGPVTYGANPKTVIAARSGDFLDAIPALSTLVAREAMTRLATREDLAAAVRHLQTPQDPPTGRSVGLVHAELLAELG